MPKGLTLPKLQHLSTGPSEVKDLKNFSGLQAPMLKDFGFRRSTIASLEGLDQIHAPFERLIFWNLRCE